MGIIHVVRVAIIMCLPRGLVVAITPLAGTGKLFTWNARAIIQGAEIVKEIWKPRVTVAALLEQDGRFLIVEERVAGKLVYNQPAGHLEDGEGLVAAVVRETLEETAWHFQPETVTGIYRWRHPQRQETYLRVAFAGKGLYHDAGRELDADIERILWLTPEEIRARNGSLRSPLVLRCLDDYLAGNSASLALLGDVE